jgi:aerobic carbon-monoxide dehydrogenase medium subunit
MKAADFAYRRPADLAGALAVLSAEGDEVAPLAGGQSLMPMMNFRVAQPAVLLDLADVAELRGVTAGPEGLRIGAMTRYAQLATNPLVMQGAPLIGLALPHIAHAAVRNRGTIGGSVALADPAAEMPALLLAMGARIELVSSGASRVVAADDFFLGLYETARAPDELVAAIHIPADAGQRRAGFYELARRHGDYAMAGVAITAGGAKGQALDAPRIAFFGVSDRALRAPRAEAALAGQMAEGAALAAAVDALSDLPINGDLHTPPEMKLKLAGVVLRRALAGM